MCSPKMNGGVGLEGGSPEEENEGDGVQVSLKATTTNDPIGRRIIQKPGWGVEGVADKDTLPCLRRKLSALRRVNVKIGGATENTDNREIWVATSKGREGDGRGTFRQGVVTKVYHSKEHKTSETVRES